MFISDAVLAQPLTRWVTLPWTCYDTYTLEELAGRTCLGCCTLTHLKHPLKSLEFDAAGTARMLAQVP